MLCQPCSWQRCSVSVLWGLGAKCQVLPTVPQSALHPAPWCWYRTLWDIQGDASRPSCTHTAITGMLGLPEKQQSKTPGVPGQPSVGLLSSAYLELFLICNSLIACSDLGLSLLRT